MGINKMTKTEYLYGHNKTRYADLPHYVAIEQQREDGKELLQKLYDIDNNDFETRLRVHKVQKAIKWCEDILEEEEC